MEATQPPNFSQLFDYKLYAIERHFNGVSYRKIALEIKEKYNKDIKEGTLKWWFYKNGPLAPFYKEYIADTIDLEIEDARNFIKGNLTKAVKILFWIMSNQGGTIAQVRAAVEILNFGLDKMPYRGNENENKETRVLEILEAIKKSKQNDEVQS